MSDTIDIRDAIKAALEGLGKFRQVETYAGQLEGEIAKLPIKYPAAFVVYAGDTDNEGSPRPVPEMEFSALIAVKALKGRASAEDEALPLLDTVRDTFNGKRLGLTDIEIFWVTRRDLIAFVGNIAIYGVTIKARHTLPAPAME